jgi:predicted nucleotidyltransferase
MAAVAADTPNFLCPLYQAMSCKLKSVQVEFDLSKMLEVSVDGPLAALVEQEIEMKSFLEYLQISVELAAAAVDHSSE